MKKILFLLMGFFLLIFTHLVKADEGWVINNFQSDLVVQTDGKVAVTETIDADFGSLQKHGIYRDIPYIYYSDNGGNYYTDIQVESVTQNKAATPVRESKNGNYIRLQIGDANRTISGKLRYQIKYLATGILRSFEDHDELYYDVTGNGWPVPISKISATVTIPKNGITGTLCYEGVQRSNEKCSSQISSQNQASFVSLRSLKSTEGMTVVLGYTKGMVPIITTTVSTTTSTSYPSTSYSPNSKIATPNILALFITLFLGLGLNYYLWSKNGRDLWWKRGDTVVVEYNSPNNLRPAEVGTIIDERADTLDVTATIVDLAVRGFLTITEKDKKWIFGSTDYIFDKKEKSADGLLSYEKNLLDKIFADSTSVKLSELENKFYDDLAKVKKDLYQEVLDKKYFTDNPEKVRGKYLGIGVFILTIGIILLFIGFFESTGITEGASWGFIPSGVILMLLSQAMPRRTTSGHEIYFKILGFKMFIDKAEAYRQQFFERQNIFNEILPFAIVFGDTEKFAQAFKDLGLTPPQPAWYVSSRPFNPVLFTSNINNFSSSLTSAIASQPRSNSFVSSGSGFSGGFSGGGFGGGGGGSW